MKEKILILVRAMPEENRKHTHNVCVARINEKGEWRRLYPFQFIYGKKDIDFKKKDWIEAELAEPTNDKRNESRRVRSHKNLHQPVEDREILKVIKPHISSIKELGDNKASLGVIKPEIVGFELEVLTTNVYDEQKYISLWTDEFVKTREKVKLPLEARYVFKCQKASCTCSKKPHRIKIIDWELNELARNIMKTEKDKKIIEEKIKKKREIVGRSLV